MRSPIRMTTPGIARRSTMLLSLPLLAFAATVSAQETWTVRAAKAWISPDRAAENVAIEITGGKISTVEDAQAVDDTSAPRLRSFSKGVITAGFIDVHRAPITQDSIGERAESFTPELEASHAYDAWSTRWKRLLRRGVTSAVIAPGSENVAGGQGAFVKPGRPARSSDSASYLKFSLAREAISRNRRPTSMLGALEILRDGYASLEGRPGARLTPAQRSLATTIGGARRVAIAARTRREILASLDLLRTWQLLGCLIHGNDAADCLDALDADKTPIVLTPLGLDAARKERDLPGLLAKRGIPFAFAGESMDEREMPALQTSLALAVRDGLAPEAALAAVTTTPALIAGRSEQVGTLLIGRDADLVVWSGDPWDLRSRVLLVVQDGRIVHDAALTHSMNTKNEVSGR